MTDHKKPTYEELEAAIQRDKQWTWKRFLAAVGFGLVAPVFLFTLAFGPWKKKAAPHAIAPDMVGIYGVATEGRISTDLPPAEDAIDQAHALAKARAIAEHDFIQFKKEAARGATQTAPKDGPPAPTAPSPTLGLLAIGVLGLGLWAFSNRDLHAGWGVCAAAGIIGSLFLGDHALDGGSFQAFSSFLDLRPAEFFNLPVGQLGLILFAAVTAVMGIRQLPELMDACFSLARKITEAIRDGLARGLDSLGIAIKGYGDICWWLAGKAVR